jgi:hypothetical protein
MSSNHNALGSRSQSRSRARSWASTGVLAVLGGAITVASWVGGEHSLAIMLGIFYVVCCVGSYLWSRGHGDVAAIMRLSGDERQRLIDVRATAIAGIASLAFCIGGAVVDLARGGTGNPWILICAVGGVTYAVAVAVLVRRA